VTNADNGGFIVMLSESTKIEERIRSIISRLSAKPKRGNVLRIRCKMCGFNLLITLDLWH
jgi:hypothetical protein